ncbi:hypothetical protein AGMMS49545_02220 [Betaproteobacteria bacterium]|nr:hypothetical protein AGMMS49545_02220 [Betaproteobacteria bacterium]GHU43813.1 hypothetical protein AGMMS50289_10890 [Betaproteobacteria bacterium]
MIDALLIRFGALKIALIFGLVVFAGAFSAGWTVNGWRLSARHDETLLEASNAVINALEKARAVEATGYAIAQRQLALEALNLKLSKERDDALRKTTSGRACFNGATVRLLNDRDQGAGIRSGLPAPARLAVGSFAALTADSFQFQDGDESSDTDVALWAGYAIDRYDACRGRIDAIRAFYEGQK